MACALHFGPSRKNGKRVKMMDLAHATEECTGNWRLVGASESRVILCERCAIEFPATPENRLAAIDENYAGIYLRRLTAEGIAHRGADREPGS